jgi:C4-dicarboxylate-specific signal transduction histidine kinase
VKDYGQPPLVDIDEARMAQVFVNLLVNATQSFAEGHSDENEIRIATSTDAFGRAVIEIRDTGQGIPPLVLGRIFDPFFTTKAVGAGTGLGLSICHAIVTAMGGEISATSELGRGPRPKHIPKTHLTRFLKRSPQNTSHTICEMHEVDLSGPDPDLLGVKMTPSA